MGPLHLRPTVIRDARSGDRINGDPDLDSISRFASMDGATHHGTDRNRAGFRTAGVLAGRIDSEQEGRREKRK